MKVVYWSQGGNTQAMADAVAEGIRNAGKEAEVIDMDGYSVDELKDEAVYALGCPAMGDEVLEETIVEPFVSDLEGSMSGKKIALFGSYGWGDGQWMRDWEERCKQAGAVLAAESVIANDAPDDDAVQQCKDLGAALA